MFSGYKKNLDTVLRDAGRLAVSYYGKVLPRMVKQDGSFYTQADVAVEKFLKHHLQIIEPHAGYVAEESGMTNAENEYMWVIDPIDGTTNFASGFPYFCISVALTQQKIPVVGAIYYPILDQLFYAERQSGAVCNDKPLHVSSVDCLDQALIAIGLSCRKSMPADVSAINQAIIKKSRAIRHCGSVALDLAFVAAGVFDAVFLNGLGWWDIAAGIVLVEEAGGMTMDHKGNPLRPGYESCIAGGKAILPHIKEAAIDCFI